MSPVKSAWKPQSGSCGGRVTYRMVTCTSGGVISSPPEAFLGRMLRFSAAHSISCTACGVSPSTARTMRRVMVAGMAAEGEGVR